MPPQPTGNLSSIVAVLTRRSRLLGPISGNFFLVLATTLLIIATVIADVLPGFGGARFIGHADQAELAIVARNMMEGRGAVTDVIWLLRDGGMPGNSVTHPEDYWSVYVAAIISIFFNFFGATREALLLSASVFKSSIAVLCGFWVAVFTNRNRFAIFTSIATVALWPTMLRVVQGLNDVYLTFFLTLFVTLFSYAVARNRVLLFVLSGLALGTAIGVKPSGALLFGVIAIFTVIAWSIVLKPGNFVGLVVGTVVALVPLVLHNYLSFGEIAVVRPPAYELVNKAAQIREVTGDHNRGFYDPEPVSITTPSTGTAKIALRRFMKWCTAVVVIGTLIPHFMLFFVSHYYFRLLTEYRSLLWLSTPETVFAIIVFLLGIGAAILACVISYEERYWNFLFPLFAVLTIVSMVSLSRYFLPLLISLAFLNGAHYYYVDRNVEMMPKAYHTLARLVSKDSIILTHDPWETTFHTRIKSVALPYTSKDKVLLDVAKRYGANYLVIVDRKARHPFYYPMQNSGQLPHYLEKVYYSNDLLVAKIKH